MGLFDFLKKKPADAPPAPTSPSTPTDSPAPPPARPEPVTTPRAAETAAAPRPAEAGKPAEPAKKRELPEFVEATDAFGRRVRLSRDEYLKNVLPKLLEVHGNDPERLVALILQGVRDGLAPALIPAANRLTVVDKDPDRALSVLALVFRDAGELDDAEATLKELLQKRPQSPNARVGLAVLAEQRGDAAKAESLAWEALQLDTNHADAVHCWLQMRHRVVGDAGYRAELAKAAALPNSWRAPLWLARHDLQNGREDEAIAAYREILARAGNESDALVMASGDLVQAQRHDLVKELIAPRFQAGRHHPHVGLALLHHLLQTQDHVAGAELLHRMFLHYGHMIGDQLQPFTAEFDRLRLQKLPPPAPLPANARIGLYRFDRPAWFAGLDDPTWLLPPKAADSKHVMFMALAVDGQPSVPPGREEEFGRLTRSVPLFLAEQVWLSTPHRGTCGLPIAENGGFVVMGRPWPEEQIAMQLGDRERASTILVTGLLRIDGDQRRVDLWAYDCNTKQRVGHAASEGTMQDLGRMLLQLMGELWTSIGGPANHKPPVGDEAFWARYADGLGQHATLVVTQAGGMPRERLFGERYVAQWVQQVALSETRWQPGFWLYASTLGVLQQLGSNVPKEHARFVAEIFRQSPPNTAFARLAVKPLRATGVDGIWQSRRPEILAAAAGDANFAAWLARAEAAK